MMERGRPARKKTRSGRDARAPLFFHANANRAFARLTLADLVKWTAVVGRNASKTIFPVKTPRLFHIHTFRLNFCSACLD
jgi:hypothetical protein